MAANAAEGDNRLIVSKSALPLRHAAMLAIASVLLIAGWQAFIVHQLRGGDWTSLFCAGDRFPPPPALQNSTYLFPKSDGYDGQFYRYVAHDPWMQHGYGQFIDDARHRYGRILIPLLAHLLGGGSVAGVDAAFICLVFASIGLGVYWSALWCAARGLAPEWGLVFLLTPATITSADRMLVDALLCAFFAGFACYATRGEPVRLWIVCALAPLTRETGLLLAGAVVLDALWHRQWKRSALFSLCAGPTLAWFAFVHAHTPPSAITRLMSWPFVGIIVRFFRVDPVPGVSALVATIVQGLAAASVLALLVAILLAFFWITRRGALDALSISVALFAALAATANSHDVLVDAFGFGRVNSPLLLWLMVEAADRRIVWAALPSAVVTLATLPVPAGALLRAVGLVR